MIRLSVVVPTYNQEHYLRVALQSVLAQTYEQLEIIVVNDGSSDSSFDIITEFAQKDSRFIVIDQANKGYGASCNTGIKYASGDYIAIFEPDDMLDSLFYEKLVIEAEQSLADIVKCERFYKLDNERGGGTTRLCPEETNGNVEERISLMWRSHPALWNGIYRRRFLLENHVVFPESSGASFQDAQFIVSLYYCNPKISFVKYAGYYYRQHAAQSIALADEKVDAVIFNWNQQYDWLREKNVPNYDFFMFITFSQFYSLVGLRLAKPFNKEKLLFEVKRIKKLLEVDKLPSQYAHRDICFLYTCLRWFKVAEFIVATVSNISAFKRFLFHKIYP